jgi:DNA repair photolyase
MEPRTSTPAARLRAVRGLREAGVPVGVMVAPIIPGLTDRAIPGVLEAAAGAGAQWAGYTVLRLPWAVRPIFLEWLERTRPLAKGRVESHIRAVRGGRLNGTDFGSRMSGDGPAAEQIRQMFRVFAARHGLLGNWPALDGSHFRLPAPPRPKDPPPDKPDAEGQLRLF